jgi:hypothetical protein
MAKTRPETDALIVVMALIDHVYYFYRSSVVDAGSKS